MRERCLANPAVHGQWHLHWTHTKPTAKTTHPQAKTSHDGKRRQGTAALHVTDSAAAAGDDVDAAISAWANGDEDGAALMTYVEPAADVDATTAPFHAVASDALQRKATEAAHALRVARARRAAAQRTVDEALALQIAHDEAEVLRLLHNDRESGSDGPPQLISGSDSDDDSADDDSEKVSAPMHSTDYASSCTGPSVQYMYIISVLDQYSVSSSASR